MKGKLYHPNKPPNNDEPNSFSQSRPYYPTTSKGCTGPCTSALHAGFANSTGWGGSRIFFILTYAQY